MKRALILDLDNTIYPVSSIADNLFDQLFNLLDQSAEITELNITAVKDELTRRPYHLVADKFNFSKELKDQGISFLKNITYDLPMQPFEDYQHIQLAQTDKFLVTTGFSKLQWSKVKMLNIEADFKEIHIVDPEISAQTKKDVFAAIMERYNYSVEEVLVIGDDPESEIKAAAELGIETFLFDPHNKHADAVFSFRSGALRDALDYI
ncbi:HAD family hydrolase [Mucilaginibacter sp.]|uniref:HAD family hydrolase n=1 Tax=Mucilaginibacter sp. TaxID=1882438 RepID=UPI003D0AF26F